MAPTRQGQQRPEEASAPRISDAEWQVMQVLWDREPITSSEVVAELEPKHDWHPKTIRTLLGRLVKKGFAHAEPGEGGRFEYRSAVAKRAAVRSEGSSFMERVFGGDAASLLLHFAKNAKLSAEEAEELRNLLDEAPEGPPTDRQPATDEEETS